MSVKNVLIILGMALFINGCKHHDMKIVSEQYPNIKWGFTTQTFIESTPVSVENAKEFIAYARKQGFSWIELRDPDASLTLEECRQIASFAALHDIEINYSTQRGFLEDDFWGVFYKAVERSAIFKGPSYCRALAKIGGGEFGWNEEEFNLLVKTANQASAIAEKQGLRLVAENADTGIDGSGRSYYGLLQFMEQTDPKVLLQLDTANLFTGPEPVSSEQAERLIRKYASRISYLHLKSAKDGKPLVVLDRNPLDFETILSIMHNEGVEYVAIELVSEKEQQKNYQNMASSINYLVQKDIICIK